MEKKTRLQPVHKIDSTDCVDQHLVKPNKSKKSKASDSKQNLSFNSITDSDIISDDPAVQLKENVIFPLNVPEAAKSTKEKLSKRKKFVTATSSLEENNALKAVAKVVAGSKIKKSGKHPSGENSTNQAVSDEWLESTTLVNEKIAAVVDKQKQDVDGPNLSVATKSTKEKIPKRKKLVTATNSSEDDNALKAVAKVVAAGKIKKSNKHSSGENSTLNQAVSDEGLESTILVNDKNDAVVDEQKQDVNAPDLSVATKSTKERVSKKKKLVTATNSSEDDNALKAVAKVVAGSKINKSGKHPSGENSTNQAVSDEGLESTTLVNEKIAAVVDKQKQDVDAPNLSVATKSTKEKIPKRKKLVTATNSSEDDNALKAVAKVVAAGKIKKSNKHSSGENSTLNQAVSDEGLESTILVNDKNDAVVDEQKQDVNAPDLSVATKSTKERVSKKKKLVTATNSSEDDNALKAVAKVVAGSKINKSGKHPSGENSTNQAVSDEGLESTTLVNEKNAAVVDKQKQDVDAPDLSVATKSTKEKISKRKKLVTATNSSEDDNALKAVAKVVAAGKIKKSNKHSSGENSTNQAVSNEGIESKETTLVNKKNATVVDEQKQDVDTPDLSVATKSTKEKVSKSKNFSKSTNYLADDDTIDAVNGVLVGKKAKKNSGKHESDEIPIKVPSESDEAIKSKGISLAMDMKNSTVVDQHKKDFIAPALLAITKTTKEKGSKNKKSTKTTNESVEDNSILAVTEVLVGCKKMKSSKHTSDENSATGAVKLLSESYKVVDSAAITLLGEENCLEVEAQINYVTNDAIKITEKGKTSSCEAKTVERALKAGKIEKTDNGNRKTSHSTANEIVVAKPIEQIKKSKAEAVIDELSVKPTVEFNDSYEACKVPIDKQKSRRPKKTNATIKKTFAVVNASDEVAAGKPKKKMKESKQEAVFADLSVNRTYEFDDTSELVEEVKKPKNKRKNRELKKTDVSIEEALNAVSPPSAPTEIDAKTAVVKLKRKYKKKETQAISINEFHDKSKKKTATNDILETKVNIESSQEVNLSQECVVGKIKKKSKKTVANAETEDYVADVQSKDQLVTANDEVTTSKGLKVKKSTKVKSAVKISELDKAIDGSNSHAELGKNSKVSASCNLSNPSQKSLCDIKTGRKRKNEREKDYIEEKERITCEKVTKTSEGASLDDCGKNRKSSQVEHAHTGQSDISISNDVVLQGTKPEEITALPLDLLVTSKKAKSKKPKCVEVREEMNECIDDVISEVSEVDINAHGKRKNKSRKRGKDDNNAAVLSIDTPMDVVSKEDSSPRKKSKFGKNELTAEDNQKLTDVMSSVAEENAVSSTSAIVLSEPKVVANLGQWATADFASAERLPKFVRLLGGLKNKTMDTRPGTLFSRADAPKPAPSSTAMSRAEEEQFNKSLEKQFSEGLDFQFGAQKGVGFGFKPALNANKKIHIDANVVRSKTFDD